MFYLSDNQCTVVQCPKQSLLNQVFNLQKIGPVLYPLIMTMSLIKQRLLEQGQVLPLYVEHMFCKLLVSAASRAYFVK